MVSRVGFVVALALGATEGFAPSPPAQTFARRAPVVSQSFEEYMKSRADIQAAPAAPPAPAPAAYAPPAAPAPAPAAYAPPAAAPPAPPAAAAPPKAAAAPAPVAAAPFASSSAPLPHNWARIVHTGKVYSGLMNLADKWPRDDWRARGGVDLSKQAGWPAGWVPETGMEGPVVHKWAIGGEGPAKSWNDSNNYLLEIDGLIVPVKSDGLELAASMDF